MIICLAVVLNYKSTGAEENAWPAITDTVTVTIITVLAIWKRGDLTRLTTLEWASIILCLSSLAGWWITKDDPVLARWSFALAMMADVAACAPVVHASWTTPQYDRPYTWILYGVANTIGMGAISDHTVANYTLPVYLIGLSVLVATPLIRYRIKNAIPIKEWI